MLSSVSILRKLEFLLNSRAEEEGAEEKGGTQQNASYH